mgnify:CR=1 FL=1
MLELHHAIRSIPKPVIAMVNGYSIGGGNVLQVVCDLSIASENARFGQTGPKVGSFDAGFGSSYLARFSSRSILRERSLPACGISDYMGKTLISRYFIGILNYGNIGYWSKFGSRFSRNAFLPSCASSIM